MHKKLIPAAIAATTLLLPLAGHAQVTTGTDNAGNYGATSGPSGYNTLNKGTGFGAFAVTSNNANPPYAGTFTAASGTSIDTGGFAFGLYANGGTAAAPATVMITRPFTTALQNAGDQFSVQLDLPSFSSATADQTFSFVVGPETLTLTSGGYALTGGTVVSTLAPTDTILNTTFAVLANNKYSFTVTGAGADIASATGTLAGPVSQFAINGANLPANAYFNNLSVTNVAAPEPSSVASLLIGAAVLGGAILARRRRQTA